MRNQAVMPWDYMKNGEPRGRRLYGIIANCIRDCESVLDMNCGYAPLYPYLKAMEYYGFDSNAECIEHLILNYPQGHWMLAEDNWYVPPGRIDILMLLGVVNGKHPLDSKTQNESFKKLFWVCKPKVVVIEHSQRIDIKKIKAIVVNEQYDLIGAGRYDAGFGGHHAQRLVWVFETCSINRL